METAMIEKEPAGLTALERLKQLKAEEAKLVEEAKSEALANARQAIEDLNSVGLHYELVNSQEKAGKGRAAKGSGAEAKYGDGKGNFWSGRGRPAKWLQELIEQGHNKQEYRLQKE
jgi:DNA-binding protein H-NS